MIRLKNDSGFALILTLVITALMVAVVVEMIHQVYVDTSHSRGFRDGLQASMLAESGVEGVAKLIMPQIFRALASKQQLTTSLSDAWAKPIKLDDEAGSLTIMITEESGKININDLVDPIGTDNVDTKNALLRLGKLLTPQLPDTIWPPVADWIRLPGSATHSSGVAPSYYGALNPPYKPRNAPLLTLTELTLIKGFTPDMPRRLRPFLRTFPESPGMPSTVNINTAPKEVLEALTDPSTADEIMAQRSIKAIADFGWVTAKNQGLVGKIDIKGNVFRITSVATVKDSIRTVEAVVRLGTPELSNTIPTGFLSWQEY